MSIIRFRALTFAALLLSAASAAAAQEYRATISGTIKDASGGALPGVIVSIVETRTGVRTPAVTDASGQYVAPFLAPGDYDVTAELSGFKQVSRKALHIEAGSHPIIDLTLEVGSVTESVQVHAEVPILNTANASVGQTITTKEVEDLPLNGRTPMMLAQLAIGVVATSNPSLIHPFDNNAAAGWSIGGTPSQTSELLLDGAPDEIWSGSLAYSPPQDAVQEVSVKAFNTDAAYGHTFGGTLNQVLKTGTNTFHGSGYAFNQPAALTDNSFFNVKTGTAKPDNKYNQYGLTAGGPVTIPKLYDGRNKMFWFLALERLNDSQPATNLTTVPTDAERNGDFSSLLKLGPQYQLFNPLTGTLNGSTINRQPFQNNVIPGNMINPIAQAYLKYYPEPNLSGDATGFDNYINNAPSTDGFDNELGRVDYNTSSRSRLSVDVRHNFRNQVKNNFFTNIASGTTLTRNNLGATGDEVFTLNSSTVLDVRGNWTYLDEAHGGPSSGFDPTQLGYPGYIASASQYLILPFVGFSGSCGSQTSFQCLGTTGSADVPSQSLQLFSDLVKNVGHHAIKVGVDIRQYRLDAATYGNSTGLFTFGTNWITGPTSTAAAPQFGGDFASFLLGLPTSGQYDVNAQGIYRSHYFAGFVQDDWRMKPTLTVNLGLRYEYGSPYAEEQGRTVSGFDPAAATSAATAAASAYAKNPNPLLPAGQFDASGGLTFPGSDGRLYQSDSGMVSPRIGFAWTPEMLHGKTVIRGGFGIFVQPVTMANLASTGTYSSNPIINQEGFSATTTYVATNNSFLSPANTLTDPFPTGILPPTGSALGASTFLGQTVSYISPTAKEPYSLRWNVGAQHQLRSNLMVEFDYVANHTERLPIAVTQLNGIPRQYPQHAARARPGGHQSVVGDHGQPVCGAAPWHVAERIDDHRRAAPRALPAVPRRHQQHERRRARAEQQRRNVGLRQRQRARPAAPVARPHADGRVQLVAADGSGLVPERQRYGARTARVAVRSSEPFRRRRQLRAARRAGTRRAAVGDVGAAGVRGLARERDLHVPDGRSDRLDDRHGLQRRPDRARSAADQRARVQHDRVRDGLQCAVRGSHPDVPVDIRQPADGRHQQLRRVDPEELQHGRQHLPAVPVRSLQRAEPRDVRRAECHADERVVRPRHRAGEPPAVGAARPAIRVLT